MKQLLIASASLGLLLAAPLTAQDANPPAQAIEQDNHLALVDAMMPAEGLAMAHLSSMRELRAAYQRTPDLVQIEKECPGTIDLMVETMDPLIAESNEVEQGLRREAMIEILRREISSEHAKEAAEFYGSELGQRLLIATMSNRTLSQTLDSALEDVDQDTEISAEDMDADNARTAQAGVAAMSPEDVAEINRQLSGKAWFSELARIRPMMKAAGLRIANSNFAPEFEQRVEKEVGAAITAHIEACRS